jgi:hypothetical protein
VLGLLVVVAVVLARRRHAGSIITAEIAEDSREGHPSALMQKGILDCSIVLSLLHTPSSSYTSTTIYRKDASKLLEMG